MLSTSFPRNKDDLAGIFIFQLARKIARKHAVEVIAPGSAEAEKTESVDNVSVNRFTYMIPGSWQKLAYGSGILPNLKKSPAAWLCIPSFFISFFLAAFRVSRSCDVIHAHWIFSGLIGLGCRKKHTTPLILSVRGSDLHQTEHSPLLRGICRWILQGADRIITVSNSLNRKILDLGISPEKVSTIPNGVDTTMFKPRNRGRARNRLGLPENGKMILYVGRIIPLKGLDVLMQAMPAICGQVKNVHLYLVGDGPQMLELEDTAKKEGISDRVHFRGKQSPSMIPFWMNAADLTVLPSRSEGRPNVILESFASSTPVLASDVGGIPEFVSDGTNGFLVPYGNPGLLAERAVTLLLDEALRSRLSRNAQASIARTGLTWDLAAGQHEELYESALAEMKNRKKS